MLAKKPYRVLIVGPSWVGDMVMAQALFKTLKQRDPEMLIDVIAPAWSRPLLKRMPEVNQAIDMPAGHGQLLLKARYQLGTSLRNRYDQAILLPNSLKSALVPAFAKIPLRTGWRGEMRFGLLNDMRLLDKKRYPLMVSRFTALAFAANTAPPQENPRPHLVVDQNGIPALLQKFSLNRQRPILVLCPGAEFGAAKRWPHEHYQAVAENRIKNGWQVWLMGSAKDQPVAQLIGDGLAEDVRPHCVNLAGSTELADAIDLMSLADAVISNDSGLMHIAAALQRPLVVVYGSTSPEFTPPLSDNVRMESIPVECGPCFKRECPLQHMKCLNELPPGRVIAALAELTNT